MNESELAVRAAAGDTAAFTALVRMHEGAVRRFLTRLAGDNADDLAQETFVTAWRRASHFRAVGSYRGWLFRIGWTTFLDVHRAAGRRDTRERAFEPQRADIDPDLPLDLARALGRLPKRERAAALLCFAEGCSHGEAAAIMEMPLGTLKSVLARARRALTEQLETADA